MNHSIFVGCSPLDQVFADSVVKHLERDNLLCWIAARNQNLKTVQPWPLLTLQAINQAEVVLLVASNKTELPGQLVDEIQIAQAAHKPLVVLHLGTSVVPQSWPKSFVDAHHVTAATIDPTLWTADLLHCIRRLLIAQPMAIAFDETIVANAQTGNELAMEYLLTKYKTFVSTLLRAKSYAIVGADYEDLFQEGMIGLYKAVRDFHADRAANFRAFAYVCIIRQIITAIKTATRQKHLLLNNYYSLSELMGTDDDGANLSAGNAPQFDVMASPETSNPEIMLVEQESFLDLQQSMCQGLTDLELRVLKARVKGRGYQEIVSDLGLPFKCIDNALQRARRKVERNIAAAHAA